MDRRIREGAHAALICVAIGLAISARGVRVEAQQPVSINAAAPELIEGAWLNTPKNAPLKMASRKGKVTVVEFWTFG